jgi:hypothetical protein
LLKVEKKQAKENINSFALIAEAKKGRVVLTVVAVIDRVHH